MAKNAILLTMFILLTCNLFGQVNNVKIAVLDFTNESGQNQYNYLERTLSENIITTFAGGPNLTVVERFRLVGALSKLCLAQIRKVASRIAYAVIISQIKIENQYF